MKKYSPEGLAARIVQYDVRPLFTTNDPHWWGWLEMVIASRIREELERPRREHVGKSG